MAMRRWLEGSRSSSNNNCLRSSMGFDGGILIVFLILFGLAPFSTLVHSPFVRGGQSTVTTQPLEVQNHRFGARTLEEVVQVEDTSEWTNDTASYDGRSLSISQIWFSTSVRMLGWKVIFYKYAKRHTAARVSYKKIIQNVAAVCCTHLSASSLS